MEDAGFEPGSTWLSMKHGGVLRFVEKRVYERALLFPHLTGTQPGHLEQASMKSYKSGGPGAGGQAVLMFLFLDIGQRGLYLLEAKGGMS